MKKWNNTQCKLLNQKVTMKHLPAIEIETGMIMIHSYQYLEIQILMYKDSILKIKRQLNKVQQSQLTIKRS